PGTRAGGWRGGASAGPGVVLEPDPAQSGDRGAEAVRAGGRPGRARARAGRSHTGVRPEELRPRRTGRGRDRVSGQAPAAASFSPAASAAAVLPALTELFCCSFWAEMNAFTSPRVVNQLPPIRSAQR